MITQEDQDMDPARVDYQAVKKYITEHALDSRSLNREHLDHLLDSLKVPRKDLARILKIPLGCLQTSKSRPQLLRRIATHVVKEGQIPTIKEPRRQPRDMHQESFAKAKEFFASLDMERKRKPTPDDLIYLYEELRLSLAAIGRLYGCTRAAVWYWMTAAGISRRTSTESRSGDYNVRFFRSWSPPMAWVVGLLYTDGCVLKQGITLGSIDRELLEKVRALVAPRNNIYTRRQSYDPTQTIDTFQIANGEIVADLRRIGLTERKSLTMTFPSVPKDCVRHFIRGCWDGDGCFTPPDGKLTAQYSCGSEKFIKSLSMELFRAGIVQATVRLGPKEFKKIAALRDNEAATEREAQAAIREIRNVRAGLAALATKYKGGPFPLRVYKRKNAKAFELRFSTKQQLKSFYGLLYEGVPETLYLKRKHNLLKNYLDRVCSHEAQDLDSKDLASDHSTNMQ